MCQRAPASGLAPRVTRYSDGEISHAITNSKGKQRITFPIASASFSHGTGQAPVTQLGRRRRLAYASRLRLQPATAPTRRQPRLRLQLRQQILPRTRASGALPLCSLHWNNEMWFLWPLALRFPSISGLRRRISGLRPCAFNHAASADSARCGDEYEVD